jgi:hypothetical protein
MSQHDLDLANAAGAAFRADLNNALQALGTLSSGATAPSTTYARMLWADTTTNQLKRRNAANSAWVVLCSLDEAFILSRASNTILGESDRGKALVVTAGFTQTLTAASTLGDGWFVDVIIDTGVTLVIDPNASETIDGATTKSIIGPAQGRIVCNGSLFRTIGFVQAETGSFTATLTGVSGSVTGTAMWKKIGGVVTVSYPALTGTSNTTTCTVTGQPTAIQPTVARAAFIASVQNNSASPVAGRCDVGTDGVLTLYSDVAGSAFAAANVKGLNAGLTLTYGL